MTDKDKLEKIKKMADAMYYAAQQLTTDASRLHKAMDEYHKFIIHECKEEPVSEDYENALNSVAITFLQEQQIVPNFYADIIMKAVKRGANWQKEQFEKKAFPVEIGRQRSDYKCMLHGNFLHYDTGDKVKVIIIKKE
jgi:hypothetical protein